MCGIMFLAAAAIVSSLASCARIPRTVGQTTETEKPATKNAATETQSASIKKDVTVPPASIEMQPGRGRPSPAPESPGSKKPTVPKPAPRIAESLAGHDRHLIHRPFDTIAPNDFELGPLAAAGMDPSIATSLAQLEKGILDRTLPASLFGSEAAGVASIFLAESFKTMPAPDSVRFASPVVQAGGTVAIALRILVRGESGQSQEIISSALGMLVLASDEAGTMRVEHLEIDLATLGKSSVRSTTWDPYSLRIPP